MSKQLRIYNDGPLPIKYKFRENSRDCRHLIVIFSGYRPRESFDFAGSSAAYLKSAILWIEDWFDDNHAYYICTKKSGFNVAESVNSLIEYYLDKLYLNKDDCTLAGFSKGASGALYHALKYQYKNVIAVAPRMNIGSANRKRHPEVFRNMASEDSSEAARDLDTLLPTLITNTKDTKKNIYLFSSPADYQYNDEIEPYLAMYSRYENFNFIRTDSPLVIEHRNVTSYNVGLVAAIMTSCSEGLPPIYGPMQSIGDFSRVRKGKKIPPRLSSGDEAFGRPLADFQQLHLTSSGLSFRGWALSLGHEARQAGSVRVGLVLESEESSLDLETSPLVDRKLSNKFFKQSFIDYSQAGFTGEIDFSDLCPRLPLGMHRVGIKFTHTKWDFFVNEFEFVTNNIPVASNDKIYSLRKLGSALYLCVYPVIEENGFKGEVELVKHWFDNRRLHVEGIFAVRNKSYYSWSDLNNFLVFKSVEDGSVAWSCTIAKDRGKTFLSKEDPWNVYDKVYFATKNYRGVEIPSHLNQEYEIFVSQFNDHELFSFNTQLVYSASKRSILKV